MAVVNSIDVDLNARRRSLVELRSAAGPIIAARRLESTLEFGERSRLHRSGLSRLLNHFIGPPSADTLSALIAEIAGYAAGARLRASLAPRLSRHLVASAAHRRIRRAVRVKFERTNGSPGMRIKHRRPHLLAHGSAMREMDTRRAPCRSEQ